MEDRVPNVAELYVAALRDELRRTPASRGLTGTAVQWAIGAERAAEALEWAQAMVSLPQL